MSNRYCSLVGSSQIKNDYANINTGFDRIQVDMDKVASGDTIAGKASKDAYGNDIPTRYATKDEVSYQHLQIINYRLQLDFNEDVMERIFYVPGDYTFTPYSITILNNEMATGENTSEFTINSYPPEGAETMICSAFLGAGSSLWSDFITQLGVNQVVCQPGSRLMLEARSNNNNLPVMNIQIIGRLFHLGD